MAEHRPIENQLIAPVKQSEIVHTKPGRRGWKYTDEAYHRRWLARVMKSIVKHPSGCWLWQGVKTPTGYGQTNYRGVTNNVHRLMYQVIKGVKLKTEQYVLHTCDVPNCCNLDHLWLGTAKDNSQDCARKRRHYAFSRTHCPQGHEYTPENTYYMRSASGGKARNCKMCSVIRGRLRAGWPEDEARKLPRLGHGYRRQGAT